MSKVVAELVKYDERKTKKEKVYHLAFFKTIEGSEFELFDWKKWSKPELVHKWFWVTYDEKNDYPKIDSVSETDKPTVSKQTSVTEASNTTSDVKSEPKIIQRPPSLSVSPKYLAMKLAVEMVCNESIEIDKKEARLFSYYEKILGEFV